MMDPVFEFSRTVIAQNAGGNGKCHEDYHLEPFLWCVVNYFCEEEIEAGWPLVDPNPKLYCRKRCHCTRASPIPIPHYDSK
jgi:hypothetical protein